MALLTELDPAPQKSPRARPYCRDLIFSEQHRHRLLEPGAYANRSSLLHQQRPFAAAWYRHPGSLSYDGTR
jgi:hypothetical protein